MTWFGTFFIWTFMNAGLWSSGIPAVGDSFHGRPSFASVSSSRGPLPAWHQGDVIYAGSRDLKEVALTFDDGPDNLYTPAILDVLRKYRVKATFFVLGKQAQKYPQVLAQIRKEGHVVGNHSWDHAVLTKLGNAQLDQEISQTEAVVKEITGESTVLIRPPYGMTSPRVVQALRNRGYTVVDWSVDTRDWAATPPDKIVQTVLSQVRPGGIILEHCAGQPVEHLENTVTALPVIIQKLKSQGYEFVTIPQLIADSKAKTVGASQPKQSLSLTSVNKEQEWRPLN